MDDAGYVYVANAPQVSNPQGSILVFAPGLNGEVAPIQVISGSSTMLAAPTGIAVH
jgi:hypothetical protein